MRFSWSFCIRFHVVSEFDDSKRSCRRRLAGHNERRRKNSNEATGKSLSQGLLSNFWFLLVSKFSRVIHGLHRVDALKNKKKSIELIDVMQQFERLYLPVITVGQCTHVTGLSFFGRFQNSLCWR